jgi:hypothetical protein
MGGQAFQGSGVGGRERQASRRAPGRARSRRNGTQRGNRPGVDGPGQGARGDAFPDSRLGRAREAPGARGPGLLARRRRSPGPRKHRPPPSRRRAELSGLVVGHRLGATVGPLRELPRPRRRRGPALRGRSAGESARGRARSRPLRLVRVPRQGPGPLLAGPEAGRRRGALLQPAAPRPAARMDRSGPPQVPRRRRSGRLRHRALPGPDVGRRSRARPAGLEGHGSRGPGPRRGDGGPRLRGLLVGRGSAPAARRGPRARTDRGRRRRPARDRDDAGHGRPLPPRPARRVARPPDALAHRRLLRRNVPLRPGAPDRGAGRRRRPPPRPRPGQRHPSRAGGVPRRVPRPPRGGRPRLRVERLHAPRQDRRRGRALGAGRLHEPQPGELDREPRAGRRRGERGVRWQDGGDVPGRPRKRHRDRAPPLVEGAARGRRSRPPGPRGGREHDARRGRCPPRRQRPRVGPGGTPAPRPGREVAHGRGRAPARRRGRRRIPLAALPGLAARRDEPVVRAGPPRPLRAAVSRAPSKVATE